MITLPVAIRSEEDRLNTKCLACVRDSSKNINEFAVFSAV